MEQQIHEMLRTQRMNDALEFFKFCAKGVDGQQQPSADYEQKLRGIHAESATMLMQYLRFQEAFEQFNLAHSDPSSVLAFFPDLLSANYAQKRLQRSESSSFFAFGS